MADIIDNVLIAIDEFLTRLFAEYALHVFAALVVILIILAVFIITMWSLPK